MLRFILACVTLFVLLTGCAPNPPITPQAGTQSEAAETVVTLAPPQPALTQPPTQESPITATPTPQAPGAQAGWISYIGEDGNIWLLHLDQGEVKPLTEDALPMANANGQTSVEYFSTAWSTDGQYLAYLRQTAVPHSQGMNISFALWVFDMQAQVSRILIENQQINGLSWQPGTHQIAFGRSIENGYFSMRGGTNASLAHGIWLVDAANGEMTELVKPEKGFSLVNPRWSPDGRLISFEEVMYMEGRGNFAYFDTQEQRYVAWNKPVGFVDWAPDRSALVYDYLNYAPSGEERIHRNTPSGGDEQALSPEIENGYAFSPIYSPTGDQVAYLTEIMDGATSQYRLMVISAQGGEPRDLAVVDQPGYLAWSADGQSLLLGTGQNSTENRQVILVSVQDASIRPLVKGFAPAWQPVTP